MPLLTYSILIHQKAIIFFLFKHKLTLVFSISKTQKDYFRTISVITNNSNFLHTPLLHLRSIFSLIKKLRLGASWHWVCGALQLLKEATPVSPATHTQCISLLPIHALAPLPPTAIHISSTFSYGYWKIPCMLLENYRNASPKSKEAQMTVSKTTPIYLTTTRREMF